jgi:hypothetical protein
MSKEREYREGFIAGYMEAGGSNAEAFQAYRDFTMPSATRELARILKERPDAD